MCDFTTFFNALSVGKWLEYTVAERFWLHLELRGAACSVALTRAGRLDSAPREVEGSRVELATSDSWRELDLPLGDCAGDVLRGFVVEAAGDVLVRGSHYAAELAGEPREVELALATTTFRKESFVERNARAVRERVAGAAGPHAGHVTMHVVDNGRTLDARALSGGGVVVHPNPNAGGAGGFARGMMEAMAQERPATHVLLMDDDVEVSPESILRTFSLLSLLRDEWSDAFVSGAMMSWDRPDLLWEDLGSFAARGECQPVKQYESLESNRMRMSDFAGILANETYTPNTRTHPDLDQRYAAWWYCCIPTSTIRREGLPLPIFVRYDDVEYGLRCKPRFITMNGICVWHVDFDLRYNAAVERYQSTRNGFVIQATSNAVPLSSIEGRLVECMLMELTKFNYTDAELILKGFEDFLKGPGYLFAPGVAEETYLTANRLRDKLIPYDELRQKVLSEFGIDLNDYDSNDLTQDYPLGLTEHGPLFRVSRMQTFRKSVNGQLFGCLKQYAGPVAVIHAKWDWPIGKIYGVDAVVVIDVPTQTGKLRKRDNERCRVLWERMQRDLNEYRESKEDIDALYREARPLVTSVEYWQKYLGLRQAGPETE